MRSVLLLFVAIFLLISTAAIVKSESNLTLKEIYESAVEAYLSEKWDECIEKFLLALKEYKMYKHTLTNCRRKCRLTILDGVFMFPENIEDLHFYEKKVRETLCLMKCNQDYRDIASKRPLRRLPSYIEEKFLHLRPYEYLHICYYQRNHFQDAANAIYTFLTFHPNHEMSINNLKYYLNLPDVRKNEVVNLEAPSFQRNYIAAVSAYEKEYYKEAIEGFESSLKEYLQSEDDCRFYCEGPFDQGWHAEFTSSIANHFAYCLKCKYTCSYFLNLINGESYKDLLQTHYNYLQYAYYKLGNLEEACKAVASYLLFNPVDKTMLYNKKFYVALPKAKAVYFLPREEALAYVKRQEYERSLLRYVSMEFTNIIDIYNGTMTTEEPIDEK